MKKFRAFWMVIALLLVFSSCSKNADLNAGESVPGNIYDSSDGAEKSESIVDPTQTNADVSEGRKIIEYIELSLQTKGFDELLAKINQQISDLGGYVESSEIYGREMDSDENRSAYMKLRIPSASSGVFSEFISENSVVTNRTVSTEDVTLTYVDIESRVAALEAEKTALEKLLEQASQVSEIIDIRDKLTDVIYEIESYKSRLQTYDNLVEYSTVTVHITEVERTAVVEKQTVWQKIGTNLSNNFADVWEMTVSVFVFAVSSIPYLIPLAIIAVIALAVIRISGRKRSGNNSNTDK